MPRTSLMMRVAAWPRRKLGQLSVGSVTVGAGERRQSTPTNTPTQQTRTRGTARPVEEPHERERWPEVWQRCAARSARRSRGKGQLQGSRSDALARHRAWNDVAALRHLFVLLLLARSKVA